MVFPFEKTTPLNIGNPQTVGQGVITFNREVLSGMIYPELCNTNALSKDAVNRILEYSDGIGAPIGAYTANSKGYPYMRQKVADSIMAKDGGLYSNPDDIYLTNGASEVVALAYQMLIRNPNDGIMIPIPQYPLYSA